MDVVGRKNEKDLVLPMPKSIKSVPDSGKRRQGA
jgi:hypothetical protein